MSTFPDGVWASRAQGKKKISFFTIPNFVLVPDKYKHLVSIYGMHKLCEGILHI